MGLLSLDGPDVPEHLTAVTDEELAQAQAFHGHRCPAMPQGLRAGHLAMDLLGVARARGGGELQAIVEIGDHHFSGCFADGVQFATGCTFGKGNLWKKPLGKFALTLVDTGSGRAVRVSALYERMRQCLVMPFFAERRRGVPPFELPPEVVDPLIRDVVRRDWREMFRIQRMEGYPVQRAPESFDAAQCAGCGEMVVRTYAIAAGEHLYCPVCFDAQAHRGGESPWRWQQPPH
jgi:formylmethanofuran dehydrogenase subunit E